MTKPTDPKPRPEAEMDFTPKLDFKFDSEEVRVMGKVRHATMQQSGLYVFDNGEKFDTPKPQPTGVWVGVPKTGLRAGDVIEPLPATRHVKLSGLKTILEMTKKTKR